MFVPDSLGGSEFHIQQASARVQSHDNKPNLPHFFITPENGEGKIFFSGRGVVV